MSGHSGTGRFGTRRIVADLDAEETWRRRLRPDPPAGPLPRAVLDRISAFGTLLRIYARSDEDVLVLPRPVDRGRLTDILPRPRIAVRNEADHDQAIRPATQDDAVRWAVTHGPHGRIAARVNHRAFTLALQRRLSIVLPGTSWVASVDDLESALSAASRQGSGGRWVAKAPLSTAGRDRVVGPGEPDEARANRLRNLLRRSGGLVVEPWMERTDDFGVLLEIHEDGADLLDLHRQQIGDRGAFRGIDLDPSDVDAEHRQRLADVARAAGEALHRVGYRGPAGIDAWTWRRDEGDGAGAALHPLGEINARLSFGRVARDLAARLGRPRLSLRLGSASNLPGDAVVLLRPAADGSDDAAAWVL